MSNQNGHLKVLSGGLLENSSTSRKDFLSAFITDTRLMGVMGMYVHWKLPENNHVRDFHQFFYFDAEEFGFDSYMDYLGNDETVVEEKILSVMGGLGGRRTPLDSHQVKFTLCEYVQMNKKLNLPLPDGFEKYRFLLSQEQILSTEEQYILMCKECCPITNAYELVNYFLMRIVGKDYKAASFLCTRPVGEDIFPLFHQATFCSNSIDINEDGSFSCQSLIESESQYYIVLSEVFTDNSYVADYSVSDVLKISTTEAALMLARSEYITVFYLAEDATSFNRHLTPLTKRAMITEQLDGLLYMIYNANNSHVAKKEYRLNEDVQGIYFLSSMNQLIVVAYSLKEIQNLEKDLNSSPISKSLIPISKYEFKEPVFFEFVQSDFLDFEEFVEILRE